jgi:5-methylcytosine-specific restriction endonuclease McrA
MADPKSTSTRLCAVCSRPALRKYCGQVCATAASLARRATASTCADCQKPCRRGARRCSPCHLEWKGKAPRGADGRFPSILADRSCRFCHGRFEPRDAKTVYCSRECAFTDPNWRHGHFQSLAIKRGERAAERQRRRAALTASCLSCGRDFPCGSWFRKTCSPACQTKWLRAAAIDHYRRTRRPDPGKRRCRECLIDFEPVYPSKHRAFCSPECLNAYGNRIGKAQRRARMRDVEREPVDPIAVFDRDGWRCQLCDVATPRRLRGTCQSNAPEMDHIVPLALGGSHTYANVQCSCRRCNIAKGARPLGQLRLA